MWLGSAYVDGSACEDARSLKFRAVKADKLCLSFKKTVDLRLRLQLVKFLSDKPAIFWCVMCMECIMHQSSTTYTGYASVTVCGPALSYTCKGW